MGLPTDIRVFWPYNTGSKPIPANWTTDTAFNDAYLSGAPAGSDPSAFNQGAVNHTHTIDDHDHTTISHTHDVSGSTIIASSLNIKRILDPTVDAVSDEGHSHGVVQSANQGIGYNDTSLGPTATHGNFHPDRFTTVVIKPDDGNQELPDDAVALWDTSTPPSGWVVTDGTGPELDLNDRFALGEAGGGAVFGNDASHDHGGAGLFSHTHTAIAHTHPSKDSKSASTTHNVQPGILNGSLSRAPVHHKVSLTSTTSPNTNSSTITIDATLPSEPAHVEMLGIRNDSGAADTPDGVVLPYVGTIASIPSDFILCDGTGGTFDLQDKQFKIITSGTPGTAAGSNTHTHTSPTHTHTVTGTHTHGSTVTLTNTYAPKTQFPFTTALSSASHTHTWTIGTQTSPDTAVKAAVLQAADHRRTYREVLFIKKKISTRRVYADDTLITVSG